MKYKVYDELNSSLKYAKEIEAWDEREAAELYAEDDVDGNIDGIYSEKDDYGPMHNLQKDGQPICVVDEKNKESGPCGKMYRFRVGITEYTPIYEAQLEKETK